jgi:SAM-dependent methyltransferase
MPLPLKHTPPNQMKGLGWQMNGLAWIDPAAASLLDVGCNVGELLSAAAQLYPQLKLAGVDVNGAAIETARRNVAQADLRQCDGPTLPFADASFDHVTCIEVLEHIPRADRRASLGEVWRVLKPGGKFILRCPHAGIFQGLDVANFRFRFPRLYRTVIRRGLRDDGYRDSSAGVVWHHHFKRDEMLDLAGPGFELEAERYGGLLLMPLGDVMRWPFYRLRLYRNPLLRLVDRMIEWDLGIDYGRASFTILLVMCKPAPAT